MKNIKPVFCLNTISPVLHDLANERIETGDFMSLGCLAGNEHAMQLISDNICFYGDSLEPCFIDAYTGIRTNNAHLIGLINRILPHLRRDKLLKCGDTPPIVKTVYRGFIGDIGTGMSWTSSFSRAQWFAERYEGALGERSIVSCELKDQDLLFYTNDRKESEYVVMPDSVFNYTYIKKATSIGSQPNKLKLAEII